MEAMQPLSDAFDAINAQYVSINALVPGLNMSQYVSICLNGFRFSLFNYH